MCLALAKPAGKEIPYAIIRRGFIRNPHGAGFVVAKPTGLEIHKGFFTLSSFWDEYKYHVSNNDAALVHFRWANVGPQNILNTHPWEINSDHAMIHNGTLEGYTGFKNGLSDTGNFTNIVLKPLFADFPTLWNKPWFMSVMSRSIGFSKIAVLSKDGEIVIYNESMGFWKDGIWHSNEDGVKKFPKSMVSKKTFRKVAGTVIEEAGTPA